MKICREIIFQNRTFRDSFFSQMSVLDNGLQALGIEFVNKWIWRRKKLRVAIFPCVMLIVLGFLLKHGESVFPVIPEICVKYMRSTASVSLTKYPVHNLSSLGVQVGCWKGEVMMPLSFPKTYLSQICNYTLTIKLSPFFMACLMLFLNACSRCDKAQAVPSPLLEHPHLRMWVIVSN